MATKKVKVVKPKAAPVGRPSAYKPEYCDRAYEYALLGATDVEMAGFFGVIPQTFYNWQDQHPEFLEALMAGKHIADAKVAKSLYQRAIGYEHPEDDIRVVGGQIEVTPTIKRYAPDTAAATLWLKNRQSSKWRDKVEVDHSGKVGFDNAPVEELTGALNELLAKLK